MTWDPSSFIAVESPLAHPLHFVGLELVFAVCFGLTIRDVAARYRRGERYALFVWLVVFVYGVAMELIAFNAFPDYVHGRFTVQLFHRQLPLYVTFVYVVFHYTGLMLAWRGRIPGPTAAPGGRLGALREAVVCGLAILLLDVPFDIAGAGARWWTWVSAGARGNHDVTQRWLGVPLTSYEWYLLFGAVLAWLCRALRPRVEGKSVATYVVLAPVVALAVIVLGIVGFLPFHALEAIGVPDAAIVATHAAVALALAIRARRSEPEGAPLSGLAAIPPLLAVWHVAMIAWLWRVGGVSDGPSKLAIAALASAVMLALFVVRSPLGSDRREVSLDASGASEPAGGK